MVHQNDLCFGIQSQNADKLMRQLNSVSKPMNRCVQFIYTAYVCQHDYVGQHSQNNKKTIINWQEERIMLFTHFAFGHARKQTQFEEVKKKVRLIACVPCDRKTLKWSISTYLNCLHSFSWSYAVLAARPTIDVVSEQ